LITLAAAFDQDLTKPDEIFDCENGSVIVAGHRIHDHKPFGLLTVSEILSKSSDVWSDQDCHAPGSTEILRICPRLWIWPTDRCRAARREQGGCWKKIDNWSGVSIGSISMGQEIGRDAPCSWLPRCQPIANGGSLYKPHVISEMRRGDRVLPLTGALAATEAKESDSTGDGRDASQTDGRCSARGRNWNPSAAGWLDCRPARLVQRKRLIRQRAAIRELN